MAFFEILAVFIVIGILAYRYGKRTYSRFEEKSVKYLKPSFPFLGNFDKMTFQKESLNDLLTRIYNENSDQKYVGMFELRTPTLVVKDLDLIKDIFIKDFDHFLNHRHVIEGDLDVLFKNSLFNLHGDKWKDMRNTLTPSFTSSKMRNMFEMVEECAKGMTNFYLDKHNQTGLNEPIEIELKHEFSKFTNDVIASCAYGIKINSFIDESNEFYQYGKISTNLKGFKVFLKFIGYMISSKMMTALNISFFDARVTKFFRDMVLTTMKTRSEKNIVRQDMIQLLMETRNNLSKHNVKRVWDDDDIVAQAFIFFLGGYDTVSTCLIFFFYEMVKNPDIQKRLQSEIDEFISDSNGKLSYNDLTQLKYLDMCLSETLRKWPPINAIDRVCNKAYEFPPPNESTTDSFKVEVGEHIWVPVHTIQNDPKYYPDPEKFDPERFSEENKSNLQPMTFLSFGNGPRNCIGSRFALMEVKIIVFHMLSKFDFEAIAKTEIPVKLDVTSFTFMPKNGIHVGIKPRNFT